MIHFFLNALICSVFNLPHFDVYFAENLKNCQGQYSDSQVARCSRITGSLGKSIEEIFATVIMDKFVSTSKASELSLKKNLFKFIQIYGKENLFHKFKGRHFKDFENFMNVEKPNELQKRLTKYSIQLDKEKCVCGN